MPSRGVQASAASARPTSLLENDMHHDPITEEIRSIRHKLAEAFDNDLAKIAADFRQREAASGRTFVQLPGPLSRTNGVNSVPTTPPAQTDSAT